MSECKPCPFCGGEAEISNDVIELSKSYSVGCADWKNCIGFWTGCNYYATREEAIAAWNRRADRTATRISVPHEGHTSIGHYECGKCRGVVGAQGAYCKHCGAKLVEP